MKISVVLGLTIAAFNLDRVRSSRAKLADQAEHAMRRAKRHLGRCSQVKFVRAESEPLEDENEGLPDSVRQASKHR